MQVFSIKNERKCFRLGTIDLVHTTGHDVQRTVFRYAQKTCGKGFFGGKLFF